MMENPYSMAKLSLDAKDNLRPKRDCGFYAKYFFLFLSLIQFLIILGLVLFMVYGNAQVGTEQHVQELKGNLQQCTLSLKTRGQEAANLRRQLNASQVQAGQLQGHLTRANASHRLCNSEKVKLMEMWRRDSATLKVTEESRYSCSLLNFTCTARMAILQEQMRALELSSGLEKGKLSLEVETLKEKAEKSRQEKEECEIARRKVETQVQTYGQLEAKVLEEMTAVRQKLQTTLDQSAIPTAFTCSPYDISSIRQACLTLSGTLQTQFEAHARRVDQRVNEVAQRSAKAENDKALCQRDLESSRQQLGLQREQSEREKQKIRESYELEGKKKDDEVEWLKTQKANLQLQLDQSKQACLSMRINTIPPSGRFPGTPVGGNPMASFPGNIPSTGNHGMSGGAAINPHAFGNPSLPGRSGMPSQPNSGSQGNPSYHERFKVPENKRNPVESAKIENQPPLSPVGQPSG